MRRYIVEFDAFVYAKDDEEAKEKAVKIAKFIQSLDDNSASVTEITEKLNGLAQTRTVLKSRLEKVELNNKINQ